MDPQPSQLFLGAIQRGFDRSARFHDHITVGDLWCQVLSECTMLPGGLARMFDWDPRRSNERRCRTDTIRRCIREGLVPGLALATDEYKREIVIAVPKGEEACPTGIQTDATTVTPTAAAG